MPSHPAREAGDGRRRAERLTEWTECAAPAYVRPVPLPPLLLWMVASGLAAALAGRNELRTSPRPAPLTRTFFAYASYAVLVVVPVSIYFYAFHGDWFLLYFADVSKIPSAV